MIDTKEYRTVERAAAFLDSRDDFPDDWRDRIDLDTLDLQDGCKCICGQGSSGSYWWDVGIQMERAMLAAGEPEKVGADPRNAGWSALFADNEQYLEAWKAYITATRSPANPETDEASDTKEKTFRFESKGKNLSCEGSIRRRVSVSGTGLAPLTEAGRDKAGETSSHLLPTTA